MIKIDKPKTAPAKLTNEGVQETETLKRLYEADEYAYKTGNKKFDFNKSIYGDKTVKNALKTAQHDKCCFCERKEEVGHVEHYRGKGGYRQDENETLQYPGYYWLAYDWDNLFFSCPVCNSSYKRSFFPLDNPRERARSHNDDISREKPLIVNPSLENPEDYIEFYGYSPMDVNGNRKGAETIKWTGLDRQFINDCRKNHYSLLKAIYLLMNEPTISESKRKELKRLFDDASKPESEYASMIRCALKHGFRY